MSLNCAVWLASKLLQYIILIIVTFSGQVESDFYKSALRHFQTCYSNRKSDVPVVHSFHR